MKTSDKKWVAGFLLVLACFIFACGGGGESSTTNTSAGSPPSTPSAADGQSGPVDAPRVPDEPAEKIFDLGTEPKTDPASPHRIDSWQPATQSDKYAEILAKHMLLNPEMKNLRTSGGSIGVLHEFEVVSIANSSMMQVSFQINDYAFISNVRASDYQTDRRHTINNPVAFNGNHAYVTVLGAAKNVPKYRMFSDWEVAKAKELMAMMEEKEAALEAEANQLKREKLLRQSQARDLEKLIVQLRQNARTMADFDAGIRSQVAKGVANKLDELSGASLNWAGDEAQKLRNIVAQIRECNSQYVEGTVEPQVLLDKLAGLLDKAQALSPETEPQ